MVPSLSPWYDVADTLDGVRDKLRLQIGDIDEDRLSSCIPAAAALIDQYLDRCDMLPGPPPPALVQYALEHVAIRLYLATPAEPSQGAVVVVGFADPLDDVRALLQPYKQRLGAA